MIKKTLAAAAVSALLVLGGSSAAFGLVYPDDVDMTANPAVVTVGTPATITATDLDGLETVYFGTDGTPGGSISSIVLAGGSGPVAKTVTDGTATATFVSSAAGTFVIAVSDGETVLDTVTVTVTAPAAAGGGGGSLPATGGTVPAAALWLGVGAIGIGGIAVAAAAARRRAARR